MCAKYGFCKCVGFEQGETEYHGARCKGEYRAMQVVRYYHAIYNGFFTAFYVQEQVCVVDMVSNVENILDNIRLSNPIRFESFYLNV